VMAEKPHALVELSYLVSLYSLYGNELRFTSHMVDYMQVRPRLDVIMSGSGCKNSLDCVYLLPQT
jgi:hypothetical protein